MDKLSVPRNWNVGFDYPWAIAGCGAERPYLCKAGQWHLRVFNRKTRRYYLYDYETDIYEAE